ncbi:PREDICTED: uncharacterized protein LOC104710667 isoform X1 [Camelina sativa]|uniref:Uncharacterized protein LOC104710667 isoform X1 n=1 Tax=Camelina sativa TaxID=90675 RepID=A0ABM1QG84_CAMSA|nr:PREDICTED: uncharacterized protein LOC104710667 isoform X1 [Camelina sativa]
MFEKGLIKKEENMFQEEKRKTNYGAMCLVCFFCCFFAFQFMKLVITQPSIATSSISVIDSPISADKLSDRRELWRVSQPSTYCLKIESFTKLATSPNVEKYKTRPFQSGGYNWTFIVYHKGNVKDGAPADWVSMYVQIDNSALFNSPKEVYAEVKFFIYNRKEDKYFTVSRALKMYPRGDGEGQGNSLSVYVIAPDFKPYERVYLKAKVRIINQKYSKDMETNVESWSDQASSWGFQRFVSFADLQDTSKGLLVNDTLKLEVEFEDLSNTKYFPS